MGKTGIPLDLRELEIMASSILAQKGSMKPWKNSFNLGFVGIGSVACDSIPLICSRLHPLIRRIYLFSRNEESSLKTSNWLMNECRAYPNITLLPLPSSALPEKINDIDILFQTAGNTAANREYMRKVGKEEQLDRFVIAKNNLDAKINEPIINALRENPDSNASCVILSNLTELNCLQIYAETRYNPSKIIGCNHVDKLRLDSILDAQFRKIPEALQDTGLFLKTTAFCIGHHNKARPVLSNAYFVYFTQTSARELRKMPDLIEQQIDSLSASINSQADLEIKIRQEGKEIMKSATSISTATALVDMLTAMIYNDRNALISAATPYYYKGTVLFAELPVYFREGSAFVHENLMRNCTTQDLEEFWKLLNQLARYGRGFGILKEGNRMLPVNPAVPLCTGQAETGSNIRVVGKSKTGVVVYNLLDGRKGNIRINGVGRLFPSSGGLFIQSASLSRLESNVLGTMVESEICYIDAFHSPQIYGEHLQINPLITFKGTGLTAVCFGEGQGLFASFYSDIDKKSRVQKYRFYRKEGFCSAPEELFAEDGLISCLALINPKVNDKALLLKKGNLIKKYGLSRNQGGGAGEIVNVKVEYGEAKRIVALGGIGFAVQTTSNFVIYSFLGQELARVNALCSDVNIDVRDSDRSEKTISVLAYTGRDMQMHVYRFSEGRLNLAGFKRWLAPFYENVQALKMEKNNAVILHKSGGAYCLDILPLRKWMPDIKRYNLGIEGEPSFVHPLV